MDQIVKTEFMGLELPYSSKFPVLNTLFFLVSQYSINHFKIVCSQNESICSKRLKPIVVSLNYILLLALWRSCFAINTCAIPIALNY